jgi:hypothetical protein
MLLRKHQATIMLVPENSTRELGPDAHTRSIAFLWQPYKRSAFYWEASRHVAALPVSSGVRAACQFCSFGSDEIVRPFRRTLFCNPYNKVHIFNDSVAMSLH